MADDECTATMIDPLLGFTTHKTGVEPLKLVYKCEIKICEYQKKLYAKALSPTTCFKIAKDDRLGGAKVIAVKPIKKNTKITQLGAVHYPITDQFIRTGVNDFSILSTSLNQTDKIFLGPCAYVNHDCNPNTAWVTRNKSETCLTTIKNICVGEEITVYYSENYFGVDNEDCKCRTCERTQLCHYKPKSSTTAIRQQSAAIEDTECDLDSPEIDADSDETNSESMEFSNESTVESSAQSTDIAKKRSNDTVFVAASSTVSQQQSTLIGHAERNSESMESNNESTVESVSALENMRRMCNIEFAHTSFFLKHVLTQNSATATCPLSPKMFKKKDNLKVPGLVHFEQADYKCNQCTKEFKLKHNLKYHIEHQHRQKQLLKCPKCPKMSTKIKEY